jgi:hypothetical protein
MVPGRGRLPVADRLGRLAGDADVAAAAAREVGGVIDVRNRISYRMHDRRLAG